MSLPSADQAGSVSAAEWLVKFLMSPLEAVRLTEEVNSAMVGIWFDIGNCAPFAYPEQWLRILGKKHVVGIHIKDFKRSGNIFGTADNFVPLFHGSVNWPAVMRQLMAIGFDDYLPVDGAFYVYASVRRFSNDSVEFCRRMLAEAGVAATPGPDFDRTRGHAMMRFSFAGTEADIAEAVDRLIGADVAEPFRTAGRVMREWASLYPSISGDWSRWVAQAFAFVGEQRSAAGRGPKGRAGHTPRNSGRDQPPR